jgi:hypothetical protein
MSGYAKTVLWLGLFMIVAGLARNWSVVRVTLFTDGSSDGFGGTIPTGPPSGTKSPVNGKCPTGYKMFNGVCLPTFLGPVQAG